MGKHLLKNAKVVLHFLWDNTEICNIEYKNYDYGIPLFDSADEFSIFELLKFIKDDKNFVNDYFINNHNLTMEQVDCKSPLEMALYYSFLFNSFTDGRAVKISSYDESLCFLENINYELKNMIFENCDYDDGIILNVIPEDINQAVNNETFNVYYYLRTKELAIGELFEYIDDDVDIENEYVQAACLFYHHFSRNLKELEDTYSAEHISYYLTEGEREYLSELFECNINNAVIDNETELVTWLNGGIYDSTNILKYNNTNCVFKLPPYLFSYTMDSDLIVIENDTFFDNSNSPDIRITLGEKVLDNDNKPFSKHTFNDLKENSTKHENKKIELITKINNYSIFNIDFNVYRKGMTIYSSGELYEVVITDNELTAKYQGTASKAYEIKIENINNHLKFSCTCPYYKEELVICKHIAALIIFIQENYDFFVERITTIDSENEKNK